MGVFKSFERGINERSSFLDIVREVADIPEQEAIMTCVAMGYPDDSFPANAVKSDRESNNDFVSYVGFAD